MPKPEGSTMRGKVRYFLKKNPGLWSTKRLMLEMRLAGTNASRSTVYAVLRELEQNGCATRRGRGRNTRWMVHSGAHAQALLKKAIK